MKVPQKVELQGDVEPAAWIHDSLWNWNESVGTRIGAVVPEGFDAYVRVFHGTDERWSEIASRTGRVMHPLVQFQRFDWDDVPRIGTLRPPEVEDLVEILEQHTREPMFTWFAMWEGYAELIETIPDAEHQRVRSIPAPTFGTKHRQYYLYAGLLQSVIWLSDTSWQQSPNLWWPDDRSWFVATEIDFDSTVVGCSRACADSLLLSEKLECLEVPLRGRLDIDGDTINPR